MIGLNKISFGTEKDIKENKERGIHNMVLIRAFARVIYNVYFHAWIHMLNNNLSFFRLEEFLETEEQKDQKVTLEKKEMSLRNSSSLSIA